MSDGPHRRPARLADLTWPEVRDLAAGDAVLLVPLGSTEQHGPHLPLSTDTDMAVAVCERAAALDPRLVVAPGVPYGASGEHAGFAGTVSIGTEALERLLVELGRSAAETFGRILLVSGHGGNADAVRRAVDLLRYEGRDVRAFRPASVAPPVDAHAGRTETAGLLALRPDTVRRHLIEPGDTRPLGRILPELRAGGMRAVSANGVLGDPTGATAAEGETRLAALAAALVEQVDSWPTGSVRLPQAEAL